MWMLITLCLLALPLALTFFYRAGDLEPGSPAELEVLSELDIDDGANLNDPVVDIVAVHGLGSTPAWAWTYPTTQVNWLRDLLPRALKGKCRIMVHHHKSHWRMYSLRRSFHAFASDLLQAVGQKRQRHEEIKRPLIFIGHSFGGLLIKEALVQAGQRDSLGKSVADCTSGIVFLGVPHLGSNRVLPFFGKLFAYLFYFSGSRTDLISLMEGSAELQKLHDTFLESYDSVPLACFYECTPEYLSGVDIGPVVSERSAKIVGNPTKRINIGLDTNHRGLNKFASESDGSYEKVRGQIIKMVARTPIFGRVSNRHFLVPYSRNEKYVRSGLACSELAKLRRDLIGASDEKHQRVGIHGLGGVGKTQDVLEFVYEIKANRNVFWVQAENAEQFDHDYRKLAKLVKLPGHDDPKRDIRPAVRTWLESTSSEEWVLVIDSADDRNLFFPQNNDSGSAEVDGSGLASFVPHSAKGIVIVTTRDRIIADQLCDGRTLSKVEMDPEQSYMLFRNHYPTTTTDGSTPRLLEVLHHHPLAIVHVASYLRNDPFLGPQQYLDLFVREREAQRDLLSKPGRDIRRERHSETVITTFSISFRRMAKEWPSAASLLRLMTCIGNHNIPYEFLRHSQIIDGTRDEPKLREAIGVLSQFSLLTPAENDTVDMHPLVHICAEAYMEKEDNRNTAMMRTSEILNRILPAGIYENWGVWKKYEIHVSTFADNMKVDSAESADIYYQMARYLLTVGQYWKAEKFARRSLDMRTHRPGDKNISTSGSASVLASALRYQGRWREAKDLEVRVLETISRVLGEEHPNTLTRMANLASTLWNLGQWKEAEDLEVRVLEKSMRVLGEEHPNTLTRMANLASTFSNLGQLKEAENLLARVLETSSRVLGEEHPKTLAGMANLASTFRNQGRWKKAEDLEVQVLEKSSRVLGEEHPDTLTSMTNLASTFRNQGRWKRAEDLEVRVLKTSSRVLGEEHPDTLTRVANLASTFWNQGRWKEAEDLLVRVLATSSRVLGEEHPDTLARMANLASTIRNQGRLNEAENLLVRVLATSSRVLGEEHPNTLAGTVNLASTFWDQGRWKEAEDLLVRVLEMSSRVLGEEHPDTLTSMANLAHTYASQSRVYDAVELMSKVVSIEQTKLGADHPRTKSDQQTLEVWQSQEAEYSSLEH